MSRRRYLTHENMQAHTSEGAALFRPLLRSPLNDRILATSMTPLGRELPIIDAPEMSAAQRKRPLKWCLRSPATGDVQTLAYLLIFNNYLPTFSRYHATIEWFDRPHPAKIRQLEAASI